MPSFDSAGDSMARILDLEGKGGEDALGKSTCTVQSCHFLNTRLVVQRGKDIFV